MGLTGYFRSVRVARIATLVLGGTLAAIPAEARLSHPTIGGPISGGFFQGMPVRVEARARLSEFGTDRRRGRQLPCTPPSCT